MKLLIPFTNLSTGSYKLAVSTGSMWEADILSDYMPKTSSNSIGLWETGSSGEIVPSEGTDFDDFWELDSNDDLIPKSLDFNKPFYHYLQLTSSLVSESFEHYKAFTTDLDESSKWQDELRMNHKYTTTLGDSMGLLFISDDLFNWNTGSSVLLRSNDINDNFTKWNTPTNIYGFGYISNIYWIKTMTEASKRTHTLVEYPAEDAYRNYKLYTSPSSMFSWNAIVLGAMYDLPEGNLIKNEDWTHEFRKNSITHNLNGNVNWTGWNQLPNTKRKHNIKFEHLDSTQRDKLKFLFMQGKGGLPIWFFDDLERTESWMQVRITNMLITEPFAEAFEVTYTMEEF